MSFMQAECQVCQEDQDCADLSTRKSMRDLLVFIKDRCREHCLHLKLMTALMICVNFLHKLPLKIQMHVLDYLFVCRRCYYQMLFYCETMNSKQFTTLAGSPLFTTDHQSCKWRNTAYRILLIGNSGKYEKSVASRLLKGESIGYEEFVALECKDYFTVHKIYKYRCFVVVNKTSWDAREISKVVVSILQLKYPCMQLAQKYVVRYHPGGPHWSHPKWCILYIGSGKHSITRYVYIVHPNRLKEVPGYPRLNLCE